MPFQRLHFVSEDVVFALQLVILSLQFQVRVPLLLVSLLHLAVRKVYLLVALFNAVLLLSQSLFQAFYLARGLSQAVSKLAHGCAMGVIISCTSLGGA